MTILNKNLLIALMILPAIPIAHAEIYVAPLMGIAGGGAVTNSDGEAFDIEPSASFSMTVETDFEQGRIGLFYSHQSSQVETEKLDATIQYLMFQSSMYYDLPSHAQGYVGIGLGGSYVNTDWSDSHTGFAASLFGGLEYPLNDNIRLTSQVRWLGTVVDNNTSGVCNLPSSGTNDCLIRFETDWMNQFSFNAGLVITF